MENENINLTQVNTYLTLINLSINVSFYIYFIMKVALKNCSKIKKHNKNILDTLENNKEVNFKLSELINIKNELYLNPVSM